MCATDREDPDHNNALVSNAIGASQHLPPGGNTAEDLNIQWRSWARQDIQLIPQSHKGGGLFG